MAQSPSPAGRWPLAHTLPKPFPSALCRPPCWPHDAPYAHMYVYTDAYCARRPAYVGGRTTPRCMPGPLGIPLRARCWLKLRLGQGCTCAMRLRSRPKVALEHVRLPACRQSPPRDRRFLHAPCMLAPPAKNPCQAHAARMRVPPRTTLAPYVCMRGHGLCVWQEPSRRFNCHAARVFLSPSLKSCGHLPGMPVPQTLYLIPSWCVHKSVCLSDVCLSFISSVFGSRLA